MNLLAGTPMLSLRRNRRSRSSRRLIRDDTELRSSLRKRRGRTSRVQRPEIDAFLDEFGAPIIQPALLLRPPHPGAAAARMAANPPTSQAFGARDVADDRERSRIGTRPTPTHGGRDPRCGRNSYRLRDDDNIHLARHKALVIEAVDEGRDAPTCAAGELNWPIRTRSSRASAPERGGRTPSEAKALRPRTAFGRGRGSWWTAGRTWSRHRPGEAGRRGRRTLRIQPGDVLVCDAIDPNMTFVVPMVSAVVERRGGMFIHGAIIAREYGLPCVTGCPTRPR